MSFDENAKLFQDKQKIKNYSANCYFNYINTEKRSKDGQSFLFFFYTRALFLESERENENSYPSVNLTFLLYYYNREKWEIE